MGSIEPGDRYLEQLRNFLKFVSNLWGILGGISLLFPLSNVLVRAIPLAMWDEGALAFLSPDLVTTVSTLVAIFAIFWTYGQRDSFEDNAARARRNAFLSFALGLGALLLYVVAYTLLKNDFHYSVMGWTSDDGRRVLFDLLLLVLYSGFFGLMTRSFMLLASVEYFRRESAH